jgi:hypothetical protein
MKTIKNTADTKLEIGFEGFDYTILPGELVACEDNVADFIKETCPLFDIERLSVGKEGDEVQKVKKEPSKVYTKPTIIQDMVTTKRKTDEMQPFEEIPNGIDNDGVEWVGPGVEKDSIS